MASLTKDSEGRSPYWICCYTAADGRRLKQSTKKENRKEALEVCLALERAESMARNGTLTEARTRELLSEVLQRTSGESVAHFTAEQWLRQWLDGKHEAKAEGTGTRYEQICREFIESLGGRAKLNITAIGPQDIQAFRRKRMSKGLAPSTVNLDIGIIGAAFNAAKRLGYIPMNPCAAVEALPDDEKTEKDVFTGEHVRALMDAAVSRDSKGNLVFEAGEDWRGMILLAYYTGARLQDVANMRWGSIDLAARLITYTPRKTRRSRKGRSVVVPTHPELEGYLLTLSAPDSATAFVFPKLAGHESGGKTGLSRTFARIMARAKIAGGIARKRNKQGRTVNTLTFHSLRHSFTSAMANAGVSEEVRMKLSGHTTREMHAGYTHHELEPLRAAVGAIPGLALP